jgi:[acyl-carrier-protein] S-malonyltransferase
VKVAFLFPGQGAGIEREGSAWCERSDAVRHLVESAARHAGVSADRVFENHRNGMMPTQLLEPVHTALCLGIHEDLTRRGVSPDFVAGHSLGEIAACASAGACTSEDAVALAADRGRLMAREAAKRPGGMLTLNGVTRETAEAAVSLAREGGIAGIAAHNAPDQWIVSGEWNALRQLATRYAAPPIPVAGAWHTDVLAGAVDEFRTASRRFLSAPPRVPLVSNGTGFMVTAQEDLPDLLAMQFIRPVQWAQTMTTLADSGVTDLVTVGPGRVLRGLARFNLGDRCMVHGTETADELERTAGTLAR